MIAPRLALYLLLSLTPLLIGQETATYPAQVPTDSDLLVATDDFSSKLAVPLTASSLSITLTEAKQPKYPSTLSIDSEIIKVCSGAGYTVVVCAGGRGFRSQAANHAKSSDVRATITAYHLNIDKAYLKAIMTALGANLANVVTPAQLATVTTQVGSSLKTGDDVMTALALKLNHSSGLLQLDTSSHVGVDQMPVLTGGDITAPGGSFALTVTKVGGQTSANVAAVTAAWVAPNIANSLVKLDSNGRAPATVMPALSGDATTSAGSTGVTVNSVGGQTAANIAAVSQAFQVPNTLNSTVKLDSAGKIPKGILPATPVTTVTYAATPAFDLSTSNFQRMILTGNITSFTVSNIVIGQVYIFDFIQDATGNRGITGAPAAVHGFPTLPGTCAAASHSLMQLVSTDATTLRYVAGSLCQP